MGVSARRMMDFPAHSAPIFTHDVSLKRGLSSIHVLVQMGGERHCLLGARITEEVTESQSWLWGRGCDCVCLGAPSSLASARDERRQAKGLVATFGRYLHSTFSGRESHKRR